MKQLYTGILFLFVLVGHQLTQAQPNTRCAPNCKDLNASIIAGPSGQEFHAKIFWDDIITNFDCAGPVTYSFKTSGAPAPSGGSSDDVGNEMYFLISAACDFLDGGLDVIIRNDLGMCTSRITFKRGEPSIVGRHTTVYCNDSLVDYPEEVFVNGFRPSTFLSCVGFGPEPDFAADWITKFDCQNDISQNDTLKIIYREWEVFDKVGKRAFVFDTINVLRLPGLDLNNTYCAEQDTVYCGLSDDCIGPYFVYPEDASGNMMDLDNDGSLCDTVKFIEVTYGEHGLEFSGAAFDDKCGLLVEAKAWKFPSDCSPQYKVEVYIKESCPRSVVTGACAVPGLGNVLENLGPGYWRCVFWLMDLDTVPPVSACKFDKIGEERLLDQGCYLPDQIPNIGIEDPVVLVSTSTHECVAHTYIPPICVFDEWSGIKQVKARIENIGSWILTPSDSCNDVIEGGICYESHQTVALTKLADGSPYEIMYEVYDSCHNIDTLYCYIQVKDLVKPVMSVDKGLTVSVSDKKVWVNATDFDENSYDNCGINLFLARRSDWYTACIDLCDDIEWCCAGPHGDTIWMPFLEKYKDPSDHDFYDEVEAHYSKTLDWLGNDGIPCGELIYNSWLYDLMKYTTLECIDHPYEVDGQHFRQIFENCWYDWDSCGPQIHPPDSCSSFNHFDSLTDATYQPNRFEHVDHDHENDVAQYCFDYFKDVAHLGNICGADAGKSALVDLYEQIGGGWSDAVPFGCEDACGSVRVELLAMDYWCNWSIAWADVWVEDKTPVTIAKDVLAELEITCKTYKEDRYNYGTLSHPISIEDLVTLAKNGDFEAMDSLDAIFGGYQKAWKDPYGRHVDIDGEEVICDIPFVDSACECRDTTIQFRVYDEHEGYIWKDSFYRICEYVEHDKVFQKGVAVVNCASNVNCAQSIWCEFDHCGEGYIFRKFKIWQGCPDTSAVHQSGHIPDTITRTQRIWVGNNCVLDKYMFDVPQDTSLQTCSITYDPDGSGRLVGDLHPDNTGYPSYKFDDDCKIVGIAHEDKVFKIFGGDGACYKVIRTFYFADWCGGKPTSENWYYDRELVLDSCVQKIIIFDETPPQCFIAIPAAVDSVISVAACAYNLLANVEVSDPCGVISYRWELKDISDGAIIDSGNGDLQSDTLDEFDIVSDDVPAGNFKLVVVVTDECQNEGYCEYPFTVETGKKPAPVCITSLTADLIPWDVDQDGTADTAKAIVWAVEFDRSSTGPCGEEDDSLSFFIEKLDAGTDQESFDTDRVADSLSLSCQDVGSQMVRMWVVSGTGTADYCDVILIVSNNTGFACDSVMNNSGALSGIIETELGDRVQLVEMIAESNQALSNIASGVEGNYQFNAPMGSLVTLTPFKNVAVTNGVTTMDLVFILNQITGAELLPTPYKRLAADANLDGFINSLDLLEFRQLILGDIDKLSAANSWRFVTKDYVFTTETPEKETVPERVTFNVDQQNMVQDFIGVKMGDVDNDALPDQRGPRGQNNLVFAIEDQDLKAGRIYQVTLNTTQFAKVIGYQYTLQFDPSSVLIKHVVPGTGLERMDMNNYGTANLEKGMLTSSWNTTSVGTSLESGEKIVMVEIEALKDGKLSNVLSMGSKITNAESYAAAGYGGVAIKFSGSDDLGNTVKLYQNQPNPVAEYTNVDFYLPNADRISLEIVDASGKRIYLIEGDYPEGRHSVTFQKGELPMSQVLFYSLRTNNDVITRRMVTTE